VAISAAIAHAGRQNRLRATKEKLRMDEQILIEDAGHLLDEYDRIDTMGDRAFIAAAREHYRSLTTAEQRNSWARAMACWLKDERDEERIISRSHDHNAVTRIQFHADTPVFLDGAMVPGGSDGAA
jgi:hypothetical protein